MREVDGESLENLPVGAEGGDYSMVDLDGDGVAGVLAEQGGGWFYKRNLSPISDGLDGHHVRFAPVREVAAKPASSGVPGERWQWLDVAGDGQADLVQLGGTVTGYHERDPAGGWERFVPFRSAPNLRWDDANVRLVDLTGDGRPDVLITEDDVIRWHPFAEAVGFAQGGAVPQSRDEENGPKLVLSDAALSIHLADLSGDGLSDLVRIRNGEVCYWPNLGYGRFGAKVTMDGGPWFDVADQFDPRRLRLADVDGSGPTDLLYLGREGVYLYTNELGNRWATARQIDAFPETDRGVSVQVADILGNGTSCLVWSSPLPGAAGRQMRYVDLMGGQKPHLLTWISNNLGATTRISYAPSTRFALEDDLAGRPWATRLPFPVLVVERVQTDDLVSRSRFITRYRYHHGYFDGREREFRGFGLVEQWDTEQLAVLATAESLPPAANIDPVSHVPPVLTRSWFHTGAYLEGDTLAAVFAAAYYREPGLDPGQQQALLPGDSVVAPELTPAEAREAVRALKGALLRREVYGLDGSPAEPHPYTVSQNSYTIERLQPRGLNRHPVVRTNPRETVNLEYDRALYTAAGTIVADPRAEHRLVLAVNDFGQVLESVEIVYGRRHPDPGLTAGDQAVQQRPWVTHGENRYTNTIDEPGAYRGPQPFETRTYELLGVVPGPAAATPGLMRLEDVRSKLTIAGDGTHDLSYEDSSGQGTVPGEPYRRLVEHGRTLYRGDDLAGPLGPGIQESLGLRYETYALAFPATLPAKLYAGRATDAMLAAEGGYVHLSGDSDWWVPSGRVFFSPTDSDTAVQELAYAGQHFFLPHRSVDPFGNRASVQYDDHDLLALDAQDALANRVSAGQRDAAGNLIPALDYRVLQPALVTDPNRNRVAASFDALGLVVAVALMGKSGEALGDSLAGLTVDLEPAAVNAFAADPLAAATTLLGDTSQRIIYDVDRFQTTGEPVFSAIIARESHAHVTPSGGPQVQVSFAYGDGAGRVVQHKARAAPGPVVAGGASLSPRWIGSGWTVVDNKGQPVKRYEPFFTATHGYEFAKKIGVGDTICYDPLGRVVARVHPDRTWEKTARDPWDTEEWDANDTVLVPDPGSDPDVGDWLRRLPPADYLPTWHAARVGGGLGPSQQDAAIKAAAHDGTPARALFDALGRTFLTIDDNGPAGQAATRLQLDIEGNQRTVTDARGLRVMSTDFDMLGHPVHTRSPDAGERWILADVSGKPVRSWDSRGFARRLTYDALRRTLELHVRDTLGERLAERTVYGESQGDALNHRGNVHQQFDQAGIVTNVAFDFKGNAQRSTRRLLALNGFRDDVDWSTTPALDDETFGGSVTYDALNRPIQMVAPHSGRPGTKVNVIRPGYSEAGLLQRIDGWLEQPSEPVTLLEPATATHAFVTDLEHNPRGQRTQVAHGNGVVTTYEYDPLTFRLSNLATLAGANALQDLSYAYDPVGNITSITDTANEKVFHSQQCVTPGAEYLYDAVYRLIAASGREHRGDDLQIGPDDSSRFVAAIPNDCQALRNYVETYRYDPVGNILGIKHHSGRNLAQPGQVLWSRRYQYSPDSNRLLATSLPGDPAGLPDYTATPGYTAKYSHDAHGNMASMPHLSEMRWDDRDRLRSIDMGGGGSAYYAYDAGGNRVRKVWYKQPGLVEERCYLGGFEIFRRHTSSGMTLERETLHIMDGSQRVALIETRTRGADPAPRQLVRYQHGNHLGSSQLELDDQARIISYEEYTPYGSTAYQAVRSQTQTPKRYRYTGKEREEESGLSYHVARYCAPWLGRWTSCDPIGLRGGLNVYEYVGSAPTALSDPTGSQGKRPDFETDMATMAQSFGGPSPPEVKSVDLTTKTAAGRELERRRQDAGDTLPGPSSKPTEKSFATGVASEAISLTPYAQIAESYGEGGIGEAVETLAKLELEYSAPAMLLKAIAGVLRLPQTAGEFSDTFGQAATEPDEELAGRKALRAGLLAMDITGTVVGVLEAEGLTVKKGAVRKASAGAAENPESPPTYRARGGPPATLEAAQRIANVEKPPLRYRRTVGLLETILKLGRGRRRGPTLVGGGATPLSPAQKAFAGSLGFTPVDDFPGYDAEPTLIAGAGDLGVRPTKGVVTAKVCWHCRRVYIEGMGGGHLVGPREFRFPPE